MNPLSKRKLFNAILPERKIVDHLDALHLGYLAKRKARVSLAKKFENSDKFNKLESFRSRNRLRGKLQEDIVKQRRVESPYPFNREGKFLFKASEWKSVPRSFPGNPPEVALIGRSNVGKSTLLNALLSLEEAPLIKALVSEKPGETRHLQFYCVGRNEAPKTGAPEGVAQAGPAMVITDMPGFGFAYMNNDDLVRCQEVSKMYLTRRGSNLKRVLLLLDARHGLKVGDEQFFRDLFATTSSSLSGGKKEGREQPIYPGDRASEVKWKLQIVLTKCDLVERFELARRIQVLKLKMREILPRIGYTSLPILAVSSLDNRGIIELKKELASLVVRAAPKIEVENEEVDHVQRALEGQLEHAKAQEKKSRRSWRPEEKFKIPDELDRDFMPKGGTVEDALALKDATRHKQRAGSGAWMSSRPKEVAGATVEGQEAKKKGILTEHTDRSDVLTSLGGLSATMEGNERRVQPARQYPPKHVPFVRALEMDDAEFDFEEAESPHLPVPLKARAVKAQSAPGGGGDSWEAKMLRAEEQRRKEKLTNTSLGSIKKTEGRGGGGSSAMTRLNLVNSGAAPSFLNQFPSDIFAPAPTPITPPTPTPTPGSRTWNPLKVPNSGYSGKDLDLKDSARHGMTVGKGAWVSSRSVQETVNPLPTPEKKKKRKALPSGDLERQFSERKSLLPLDDLTPQEKMKFKEHSTSQLKKNRKTSVQRLERRDRRDVQFGRKAASDLTPPDEDVGDFEEDRPPRVQRPSPRKEVKPDKVGKAPKTESKPKPVSTYEKPAEKSKKSFSKVVKEEEGKKMSKKGQRYADSFREKNFTNEYSTTSNYDMGLGPKGKGKERKERDVKSYPLSYKDDTTYNDKNEKKPFVLRPKTKFGRIVGSKANAQRAERAEREGRGFGARGSVGEAGVESKSMDPAEPKVYPSSTGRTKGRVVGKSVFVRRPLKTRK